MVLQGSVTIGFGLRERGPAGLLARDYEAARFVLGSFAFLALLRLAHGARPWLAAVASAMLKIRKNHEKRVDALICNGFY